MGYAGGTKPNPTYEESCQKNVKGQHAEVVRVIYWPEKISVSWIARWCIGRWGIENDSWTPVALKVLYALNTFHARVFRKRRVLRINVALSFIFHRFTIMPANFNEACEQRYEVRSYL